MNETTITEHVEELQKKYGCCQVCQAKYELGRHDERLADPEEKTTDLHKMKLHDYIKIEETNLYCLRVPGGWLYANPNLCFVPFCKEFTDPVKYSKFEDLTQKENTGVHKCPLCKKSFSKQHWSDKDIAELISPSTHICPRCKTTYVEDKMCLVTIPPDPNSFWVCESCFCIDGRRCMVKFGTTSSTQKTEKE